MKKWIKWILIISTLILATVLLGSIVFSITGYVFDFLKLLMGWFATASRWLAKLVDIFGISGVFVAHADIEIVQQGLQILRMGG